MKKEKCFWCWVIGMVTALLILTLTSCGSTDRIKQDVGSSPDGYVILRTRAWGEDVFWRKYDTLFSKCEYDSLKPIRYEEALMMINKYRNVRGEIEE